MAVFAATFLRLDGSDDEQFTAVVEAAAASAGDRLSCEVRAFPTWIMVTWRIPALRELSARFSTEGLGLYVIDEHVLVFELEQVRNGESIRVLERGDESGSAPGAWTRVEGAPQDWETVAFEGMTPVVGERLPYGADLRVLCAIADGLGLPWAELSACRRLPPPVPLRVVTVGEPGRDTTRRSWWRRLSE